MRFLKIPAVSLTAALASGLCVPALAAKPATGLASLPLDAQGPISAALGKDDSGYWVHRSAAGFRGENSRQTLVAEFTRQGAEVRSQNLRWRLEMRGYGYGDAVHPVKAVAPTSWFGVSSDGTPLGFRSTSIKEIWALKCELP